MSGKSIGWSPEETYRALANHEMQTWAHNTPLGGIRMTRCFSKQNILLGGLWIASGADLGFSRGGGGFSKNFPKF